MLRRLTALSAVLTLSAAGAACSQADPGFDAKVRDYLLRHPEVLEEALTKLEAERQAEQVAAAGQAIARERQALIADARDPSIGPKDAKVTVVEFSDYRCGYCKLAAPEMVELIRANPDVRFVFKEFPIFGATSEYAAKAALVAAKSGKYLPVHAALMAEKNLDQAAVDRVLTANGLDPAAVRAEGQKPEYARYFADKHALAGRLNIQGTPAFVIGDVLVPGADMEAVKAAIAAAKNS